MSSALMDVDLFERWNNSCKFQHEEGVFKNADLKILNLVLKMKMISHSLRERVEQ